MTNRPDSLNFVSVALGANDSLIGRLIDGRYEIRTRIARGGMATVYLAIDRRLDREVALKAMHSHLADGIEGAQFVSRFRREARAAARLTHPGVVAVYDQGFDGETSYLTMEYVPGTTLRRELRRHGTLTLGRTLETLDQVLAALAAAHRKDLVHRDIKPENVLITEDGTFKVADFGLARAVTEVTSTTTGTILGTIAYLAPEVISTGACDARTDIYAVGVLAYELLTGTLPHIGATPIQVAFAHVHQDIAPLATTLPWLPVGVSELIGSFLERDPVLRPPNADAALTEIRALRDRIASTTPETLERRADPPAGFVPDDDLDTATEPVDSDDEATLDTGSLEAIPLNVTAKFAPPPGQNTERVVEQPTTKFSATGVRPPVPEDDAPAEKVRRWPKVVGWIVALLLVFGGAGYGVRWWFDDGPGAWTTVPAGLVGQTKTDALEQIDDWGLTASVIEQYDDVVVAGTVMATNPSPGESIRRDGSVVVTVSLGIRMVIVPTGLIGAQFADAAAVLEMAQLNVGQPLNEYSDTVPLGEVMATSVAEGSSQPHSSTVTLTVSGGPAPVTVTQQVGRSRDDAQAALADLGLKVEFAPDASSMTVPEGHVISQYPESGTQIRRLDTVTLTISSGLPMVEVPNVTGMRTTDARDALEALGFRVEVQAPLGGVLGLVHSQDVSGEARHGTLITITVV